MMVLGDPLGLLATEKPAVEVFRDVLIREALHYQHLSIGGREVRCPYYMNWDELYSGTNYYRYVPRGGKLAPNEIEDRVSAEAVQRGIDLYKCSTQEIRDLVFELGAGVDCSGYVYNLLKAGYYAVTGETLDPHISKSDDPGKRGVTKISARDLVSPCNASMVEEIAHVRTGDIISIAGGRHVICILQVEADRLICAHSTNVISSWGPNIFPITIINHAQSIFLQKWDETDWIGLPYMQTTYPRLQESDGIYRLHCFQGLLP